MSMISQAVTSMKYNKNLRKKHRKKGIGLSGDGSIKTEFDLPKATEKDIQLLRNKLQFEHKQRRTKQVVLLIVIMLLLIAILIYFA